MDYFQFVQLLHSLQVVVLSYQLSQGAQVLLFLHRVPNAPFDKSALKLAEIQVFERCLKYGTSPDYTRKKKAEEPEMILNIKLAA